MFRVKVLNHVLGKVNQEKPTLKKRKPSYTLGENVNWYSHCGEQYGGSLKTLKIELHSGTAILLLGLYPQTKETEKNKNRNENSLIRGQK